MEEAVTARKIGRKEDSPRIFVAVGKAVSSKANERNKIKRRIKAIVAGFVRDKTFRSSILLSAKKGVIKKSFKELKEETLRELHKVV